MTVDIEGMSALANFEVIEIFNDNNPYPVLLGINWAIDMNRVINLMKQTTSFERKSLHVVVHLDPIDVPRYIEPIYDYEKSDDDLDEIYKIIARYQDWINPTANRRTPWDRESSCTFDVDEVL